jgi:hypothetical protein
MRKIENVCVGSVDEFLHEMVPQLGFHRTPIYRGQASHAWTLLPPLLREAVAKTEFASWAELEGAVLLRLKQRSRGELGYEPMSELEWMSVAQEYGLPTRLSSWTENALVALYHATKSYCDDDGVVWRILPGSDNLTISQDYEQVPEHARIYVPQSRTQAARNQKTCFLTHPLPQEDAKPECFEEHFELGEDRMHLARIVIPSTEKEFIRRRLATMGVDSSTLFPGMEGLCQQIREEIYCHTDSYEWVFPE